MGIIELSDRFFGLSKNKLQKRLQSRFDKISFKARSLTPAALAAALSACNDNQGIVGSNGDDVLGNTVSDQLLSKSKWAAKGTNDLFNLIMNGKITFRGLLAWLVIIPPALLIGSYVVLKKEIFKEVKEGLIQK